MTTRITRDVTRETSDVDPSYGKRLMVRLKEGGRIVEIWQKGRRTRFRVTYQDIWRLALKAAREAHLAERMARRRKR